jgi:hypothetical protein
MRWRLFCTVMHKDGLAYQVYCCRECEEPERLQLIADLRAWGIGGDALLLSSEWRVTPAVFVPAPRVVE